MRVKKKVANVNFYLLSMADEDTPQLIYMTVVDNYKRIKYYTRYKVAPKFWDNKKQQVKNVIAVLNRETINSSLNKIKEKTEALIIEATAKRIPITKDYIKENIDKFLYPVEVNENLFGFIEDFIEKAKTKVIKDTGRVVSPETIRKYKYVQTVLLEFQKSYRRKIDFETIDRTFFDDFLSWLTSTKDYSKNNIDKIIECLRTFLNDAKACGINKGDEYKKFKVATEPSETIYLTDDELLQIYKVDLSQTLGLDKARDLFLIGAFTGLRYSDMVRLKEGHIKGDTIELHQFKTGENITIRINSVLRAIIDKYEGKIPTPISNQKLNEHIKKVCKKAGIKELIEHQITKGGKRVITTHEKWELVSTHMGRHNQYSFPL